MTLFFRVELNCKACGGRDSYGIVGSTSAFGYPDLDSRPAEMARTALLGALQVCTHCGDCAPDVSKGPDSIRDIINSEPHRSAVSESPGSDLAGRWRRWARVCEIVGDHATASRANLSAAWASDDARQEEAARAYRAIVLENLRECADAGVIIAEVAESQELLSLDLQRRLGHYADALQIANAIASTSTNEHAREVAHFHVALIEREDCRRYSVGDAKEYAESPEDWLRRRDEKDTRRWWQFWR